jgi:sugar lactone lactonase YvrE
VHAGNLYVAGGSNSQSQNPAGVYAFSPEGTHLGFMPIPEVLLCPHTHDHWSVRHTNTLTRPLVCVCALQDEVVSCRFGGWDMRTLYVTAGGGTA